MPAEPTPRDRCDELLETLTRVLEEKSLDAALGEAARLLASVADAPVATVFLLRGAEIAGEYWHPSDQTIRERFGVAFREAVGAAAGSNAAGDPSPALETRCGTRFQISTPSGGEGFAVVASLAWPGVAPSRVGSPEGRIDRIVELLASKV